MPTSEKQLERAFAMVGTFPNPNRKVVGVDDRANLILRCTRCHVEAHVPLVQASRNCLVCMRAEKRAYAATRNRLRRAQRQHTALVAYRPKNEPLYIDEMPLPSRPPRMFEPSTDEEE